MDCTFFGVLGARGTGHFTNSMRAGRHSGRWTSAAIALVIGGSLSGCSSLGSRQLPMDRFDYNTAIANSASEQMLLNLVRLRFSEVPTFLAVNSVITQYIWSGDIGVAGATGESLNFPTWNVGGSASARYVERPTVTYSPLSGQEFATQLISPVRSDVVFSLVSSGWPPEQLLGMTIQRVNDIESVSFGESNQGAQGRSVRFSKLIELMIALAGRDAIELVRTAGPDQEGLFLDFSEDQNAETQALVREFKEVLGLDLGLSRFRVTRKIVGRGTDEVTLRMHSLLELMGMLSAGVSDTIEPLGTDGAPIETSTADASFQLRVHCHGAAPDKAFVAVRYGGSWYSIARTDEKSKRAFGLLLYLFQMQASQNQGSGPLLTVPVG